MGQGYVTTGLPAECERLFVWLYETVAADESEDAKEYG